MKAPQLNPLRSEGGTSPIVPDEFGSTAAPVGTNAPGYGACGSTRIPRGVWHRAHSESLGAMIVPHT